MEGDWVATTELPSVYEEPDKVMGEWYLKWNDINTLLKSTIPTFVRSLNGILSRDLLHSFFTSSRPCSLLVTPSLRFTGMVRFSN